MNALRTTVAAVAFATAGVFAAGAANADSLIDLTDDIWGAPGTTSGVPVTVGGVTLTAVPAPLVFQKFDAPVKPPVTSTFPLEFSLDGIGVVDDEVSLTTPTVQLLKVKLPSTLTVTGLAFLDLFFDGDLTDNVGDGGAETIRAEFRIGGAATGNFYDAVAAQPNPPANSDGGYFEVSGLNFAADEIWFYMAPNTGRDDAIADAAVAGITVVPLPAAVWLFGSALMGIAGLGYRRNRKV